MSSKPKNRVIVIPRQEDAKVLDAGFAIVFDGPYPHSGLQIFGFFLLAFFPLLSIVSCVLRIWSRRLSKGLGIGKPLYLGVCNASSPAKEHN